MSGSLVLGVAVFTVISVAYAGFSRIPYRRLRGLSVEQTVVTSMPGTAIRAVVERAMRPHRRRRCFTTPAGYECVFRYRRERGVYEVLLRIRLAPGPGGATRVHVGVTQLRFPRSGEGLAIDQSFGCDATRLRHRVVAALTSADRSAVVVSRAIRWRADARWLQATER